MCKLVKENEQQKAMECLERKLYECIEKEKHVNIHVSSVSTTIRNSVIPEDAEIFIGYIHIISGNFELEINEDFDMVIYNEDDESFYFEYDNTIVYIDLI